MEFSGERMIPGTVDPELEEEHLLRYRFASALVSGKRVLDAACGAGYGSGILGQTAHSVIGIDISQEAIDYAAEHYGADHVHFQYASVDSLPFEKHSFDIVVSFETLEHVDARIQEQFLQEIKRVLIPGGLLLISTPNRDVYDRRGENHFHVCERSFTEFSDLLTSRFSHVKFFSQQQELALCIVPNGDSEAALSGGIPENSAEYLIALCSDTALPQPVSVLWIPRPGKYRQLMDWAVENDRQNQESNEHIKKLDEHTAFLGTELDRRTQEYEQQLQAGAEYRQSLQTQIALLKYELKQKQHLQNELQENLKDKQQILDDLQGNLDRAQHERDDLQNALGQKQLLLDRQKEEYETKLAIAKAFTDSQTQEIQARDARLTEIYNSRSWKVLLIMLKVRDVVLPWGSPWRHIVGQILRFLRHPLQFFRQRQVQKHAAAMAASETLSASPILPYRKLNIPQWETPDISIIIPAYNQFDYTYHCIASILENSGDVKYEIILADDHSTDRTSQIGEIIHGLRIIRNPENLRFLKNCNNAAAQACGKALLFLNNDTRVGENWLRPLVDLLFSRDDIGMVGSKLIYPDGRLQEAGGILWQDGSAWNFGNGQDPSLPQFNYVKEADYISGAAILIRRELWTEIGGFDSRFAPAYCEDSDLAFEVRRHGYKVLLQPLSVVTHYEGISNGTDLSSGQKAYQVENQKKFFEKWKDTLAFENYPNGEHVFKAKDRSRNRYTVLVIDHYVPQYDKDCGSRTMETFLRTMVDLGYNVKFIGDNFYYDPVYSSHFEQMGIEMLLGYNYFTGWQEFIAANGEDLDAVFLTRPHISVKYMDYIRDHTHAKVVYYVQDLHYLREQREYEITGDPSLLESSKKLKGQEFYLMDRSDVALTPSTYEEQIINREISGNKGVSIPIYCYDTFDDSIPDLSDRHEIVFVGGFTHRPNENGVLWFMEHVWPLAKDALPMAKLVIIGSNPTDAIIALKRQGVEVTGYISDDELAAHYRACRVCVIPLQYGAGVKGKTLEAMYQKVPIVSTSVGTEGLDGIDALIPPADTPEEFARRLVETYNDFQTSACNAAAYHAYLRKHNSPEVLRSVMKKILE